MIYDKHGNVLGCPKCGSIWVGYQAWLKKYCCSNCDWKMERECEIDDYEDLKPVSEKKPKL